MRNLMCIALIIMCWASAGTAQPITTRADFMALVDGKTLVIRLYTLRLNVLDDGSIQGRALGYDITGSWSWIDGYFCRDMQWGGTEIEYNCQLVEKEERGLRFTTDRGAGDSALFRVR